MGVNEIIDWYCSRLGASMSPNISKDWYRKHSWVHHACHFISSNFTSMSPIREMKCMAHPWRFSLPRFLRRVLQHLEASLRFLTLQNIASMLAFLVWALSSWRSCSLFIVAAFASTPSSSITFTGDVRGFSGQFLSYTYSLFAIVFAVRCAVDGNV